MLMSVAIETNVMTDCFVLVRVLSEIQTNSAIIVSSIHLMLILIWIRTKKN